MGKMARRLMKTKRLGSTGAERRETLAGRLQLKPSEVIRQSTAAARMGVLPSQLTEWERHGFLERLSNYPVFYPRAQIDRLAVICRELRQINTAIAELILRKARLKATRVLPSKRRRT